MVLFGSLIHYLFDLLAWLDSEAIPVVEPVVEIDLDGFVLELRRGVFFPDRLGI
jgi:hypothetical protein